MLKNFIVRDQVLIAAPIERCFALSTSLELVRQELGMQISPGESRRTSGHVQAGDQLVWRGWKFGLPQMHETLITAFDPPHFFQDTMGRGRFARFQHDHTFERVQDAHGEKATLLRDEVRFALPLGWAGALVGRWVLLPHVRKLLRGRFALLKRLAEGDGWQRYLRDTPPGTPAMQ